MASNNYLWNAETTDFSLSIPPEGAWTDPGEWRLISYITLDAVALRLGLGKDRLSKRIEACFGALNVATVSCSDGRSEFVVQYGCPYAPLLQFAAARKEQLCRHFGESFRGAGQLLVSLPPSTIPYFFWKHDVVAFKGAEQRAAKALSRKFGCEYGKGLVPWAIPAESLRLRGGPSWRWWTRYLNEALP